MSNREKELFAAAKYHWEMFRPFTAKPIGAKDSATRLEQKSQIEAHEALGRAISAYEGSAT